MSKKLILVFAGVIFFSNFRLAFASLIFNEIMYDPIQDDSYNEWIELYNTDPNNSINLTNLSICGTISTDKIEGGYIEKGAMTASNNSGMILPAGGYAILTDGGSGTQVYDNFSIPSGTLALHVDGSSICGGLPNTPASPGKTISLFGPSSDSVTYPAPTSPSEGKSYQKQPDNSWILAAPTPGVVNAISDTSDTSYSSSAADIGGPLVTGYVPPTPSPISTSNSATNSQIKIQITGNNYAFADVPTTLKVEAFQSDQTELNYGKYFLNYGDGDSKEIKGNGLSGVEIFNHTYFYPGIYTATAEYYNNSYSEIPDATAKVVLDVVRNDIAISKVGDSNDFFIELVDNTAYDADLSNWILESGAKSFTLPKNTIIQAKKTLMLSSKITGFSITDENTLKLMTPQNELVFDYAAPAAPTTTPPLAPLLNQGGDGGSNYTSPDKGMGGVASSHPDPLLNKERAKAVPEIPAVSLTASVVSSDSTNNPVKNNSRATLIFILSFVFIGASAGAVYFIRRKKTIPQIGNDFKILDE
jgi:hypothetical protein